MTFRECFGLGVHERSIVAVPLSHVTGLVSVSFTMMITGGCVVFSTPLGLIAFSLSHGTLSWSETQHLRSAGLDEWIQHLTNIRGRWLAAHIGGVALFPLLGVTIWWMLPPR